MESRRQLIRAALTAIMGRSFLIRSIPPTAMPVAGNVAIPDIWHSGPKLLASRLPVFSADQWLTLRETIIQRAKKGSYTLTADDGTPTFKELIRETLTANGGGSLFAGQPGNGVETLDFIEYAFIDISRPAGAGDDVCSCSHYAFLMGRQPTENEACFYCQGGTE